MTAEPLFNLPPFSLNKQDKQAILLPMLQNLVQHHCRQSAGYAQVLRAGGFGENNFAEMVNVPFLPVSVFKNHELKSIPDADVFKVLTSSGTTGQQVSKIFLDKQTAAQQTNALAHIITSIIGQERLPMLIVDSKSVLRNRESFSARGAGIVGLSVFGKQHTYLLADNYELNVAEVTAFLNKHNGQPMLLFGFTFIVWQYLLQLAEKRNTDLSKAILFHSGGWKKMTELSVTNEVFKLKLKELFGLQQVYNFYGMVEQTGSVFIENTNGYLQCSNFSDIIIRNPHDFSEMPHGQKGLIQVISVLPESYPGFSLLTEDIGICHGEDDAVNGWQGKYFEILGRAAKAELRGCSDTALPTAISFLQSEAGGNIQQLSPQNILLPVEQLRCFVPLTQKLDWFDERTVIFLNQLSTTILKTELRQLPAIVALAYWLRKSNIETLRKKKVEITSGQTTLYRQPLGTVFHVCPGNVDTIFLYSLAVSLLAGNRNVLRISNRIESPALNRLFELMNEAMQEPEFVVFNQYISIVTYGHDDEVNRYLSLHADARIIWGGDNAVQLFRSLPTAPRCRDITFPDRLSASIIKTEALLQLTEKEFIETCRLLYNDAYVFDQLGCSSPQVIFFLGEPGIASQAENKLYNGLLQQAISKYDNDINGLASLKLNKLTDDALNETIISSKKDTNLLVFARLKSIQNNLHTCGGGYFYIAAIESLEELSSFFSKKIQTAAYFRLDESEKLQLVKVTAGKGLDRLVPVGQALAFNNYWDGYDLLEQLTQLTAVI